MHRKEGAQVEFNPKLSTIPWNQIRIEDKLYSTEKLANIHPGGPLFIKVHINIMINTKHIFTLHNLTSFAGFLRP